MSCYAVMNAMLRPGLTPHESRLYAYLTFRANGARVTWPSVPEMMSHLGASRDTIIAGTSKLAKMGLIHIKRRYRDRNLYRLVEQPGADDCPVFPGIAPAVNHDLPDGPLEGMENRTNDGPDADDDVGIPAQRNVGKPAQPVVGDSAPESIQQESNKNPTRTPPIPPSADPDPLPAADAACVPVRRLRPPIDWSAPVDPPPQPPDQGSSAIPADRTLPTFPPSKPPAKPKAPPPDYAREFAAHFWPRYPRKVAKGRSEKAYVHWRKEGITLGQIIEAMDAYDFGSRLRFMPHASTWLNDRPWETVGEQGPVFDPALRAAGFTPETAAAALRDVEIANMRQPGAGGLTAIDDGRTAS